MPNFTSKVEFDADEKMIGMVKLLDTFVLTADIGQIQRTTSIINVFCKSTPR